MERTSFSGVANIVRFNWHYYLLAALAIAFLFTSSTFLSDSYAIVFKLIAGLILLTTFVSLCVSAYIYDFSNLYTFAWLNRKSGESKIVNIHAGFDETSYLLKQIYPEAELRVFDFYDPKKHTEVSIERARRAYPQFPGTIKISTDNVPLQANTTDLILLTLAVHEVRNDHERVAFLKTLSDALSADGRIIVTEHLRDVNNFLAFNIGFFHFFAKNTWLQNFRDSGLAVTSEFNITPFITVFILQRHGTAS